MLGKLEDVASRFMHRIVDARDVVMVMAPSYGIKILDSSRWITIWHVDDANLVLASRRLAQRDVGGSFE